MEVQTRWQQQWMKIHRRSSRFLSLPARWKPNTSPWKWRSIHLRPGTYQWRNAGKWNNPRGPTWEKWSWCAFVQIPLLRWSCEEKGSVHFRERWLPGDEGQCIDQKLAGRVPTISKQYGKHPRSHVELNEVATAPSYKSLCPTRNCIQQTNVEGQRKYPYRLKSQI